MRGETEHTKKLQKGEFALYLSRIKLLCSQTSELLVLGPSDSTGTCAIVSPGSQAFRFALEQYHGLSWASSFQAANYGTSHTPLPCEATLHNKYLSIYPYIYYDIHIYMFLWIALTNTLSLQIFEKFSFLSGADSVHHALV